MFDFYPTCLEKTKHVGIFTPGCYFPHMFGFWHTCMGKGTHVWKKPHNYMFENVWLFPHMCGKSHWHAYFPLSYRWGAKVTRSQTKDTTWIETIDTFMVWLDYQLWLGERRTISRRKPWRGPACRACLCRLPAGIWLTKMIRSSEANVAS